MMGDDLRLDRGHCVKLIAQGLCDAPVQHLPSALEQVLIGRVLHQRVFETVDGIRRIAAVGNKLGGFELGERVPQCSLVEPDQRAQQRIRELAPDGSGDLADLLHRRQAVQPRHQGVVERRRDGERRQGSIEPIALGVFD
jgi:hypothetical protein